jgi:hypothetical protein
MDRCDGSGVKTLTHWRATAATTGAFVDPSAPPGALAEPRRAYYTSQMSGKRPFKATEPSSRVVQRERLGAELRQNLAKRKQVLRLRKRIDKDAASIEASPVAKISGT